MRIFEYSNKGARDINQDFIISQQLSDRGVIIVVADGMGGYSYGEIASTIVSKSIIEYVQSNLDKISPSQLLKDSIYYANDCLMLKRLSLGVKHMGTVITVLLIIGNEAYMTWLGDSRIYIYRKGVEIYKTEDHSIVNELSKRSLSSDIYRFTSIVTRSVMGDANIGKIEISHLSTIKGDIFILCTDGFHKENSITDAINYDDSKKNEMDRRSMQITDNYSFVKLEI